MKKKKPVKKTQKQLMCALYNQLSVLHTRLELGRYDLIREPSEMTYQEKLLEQVKEYMKARSKK